jgi:hypothetical protein
VSIIFRRDFGPVSSLAIDSFTLYLKGFNPISELVLNNFDPSSSLAPNSFALFFETSITDNFARD